MSLKSWLLKSPICLDPPVTTVGGQKCLGVLCSGAMSYVGQTAVMHLLNGHALWNQTGLEP